MSSRPLEALDEQVSRWVEHGIISRSQADQILDESTSQPTERGSGFLAEAMGYVGGVLVLLASFLLAVQLWPDLSVGVRLAVVAGASGLLLGVGAVLPAEPGSTGRRLRAAAWLLSSACFAFLLSLIARELDLLSADAALVVTGGSLAYGLVLWRLGGSLVQQAVVVAALAGTAASLMAELATGPDEGGLPGVGVLTVGVVWTALAERRTVGPRPAALVLGAVPWVIGSLMVEVTSWGRVMSVVAVLGLVALAVRLGQVPLLVVASLGMLLTVPAVVHSWFPGLLAVPLALLGVGALLVLVAARTLRRPTTRRQEDLEES